MLKDNKYRFGGAHTTDSSIKDCRIRGVIMRFRNMESGVEVSAVSGTHSVILSFDMDIDKTERLLGFAIGRTKIPYFRCLTQKFYPWEDPLRFWHSFWNDGALRNPPKHGRSTEGRASIRSYAFPHSQGRACTPKFVSGRRRACTRRRMKWGLEKVLSLPIGDDKREWILSKNLKRLIRLT